MTRVFIAAASPLIRAGLAALVGPEDALSIADERDGADVVVVDLGGHDEERAFNLFLADRAAHDGALVVLTAEPGAAWLQERLRENEFLRAIVSRNATPDAIIAALAGAAAGFVVVSRTSLEAFAPSGADGDDDGATHAREASTLTRREAEVLTMLAEGLGNKLIAGRMNISEHTVKFHIASIFSKLGASSRTEAVALGARRGLILL